jgi:hypothetical protein
MEEETAPEPQGPPAQEEDEGAEAPSSSPPASERHFNDHFDTGQETEQAALDASVEPTEGTPL